MKVRSTINYLKKCQRARAFANSHGYYAISKASDPTWLVNVAINRRAGWPDDPECTRGSAMPVNGKFPSKGGGEWYAHLWLRALEINTPSLIVRPAQLGEHRWLLKRLPQRFSHED